MSQPTVDQSQQENGADARLALWSALCTQQGSQAPIEPSLGACTQEQQATLQANGLETRADGQGCPQLSHAVEPALATGPSAPSSNEKMTNVDVTIASDPLEPVASPSSDEARRDQGNAPAFVLPVAMETEAQPADMAATTAPVIDTTAAALHWAYASSHQPSQHQREAQGAGVATSAEDQPMGDVDSNSLPRDQDTSQQVAPTQALDSQAGMDAPALHLRALLASEPPSQPWGDEGQEAEPSTDPMSTDATTAEPYQAPAGLDASAAAPPSTDAELADGNAASGAVDIVAEHDLQHEANSPKAELHEPQAEGHTEQQREQHNAQQHQTRTEEELLEDEDAVLEPAAAAAAAAAASGAGSPGGEPGAPAADGPKRLRRLRRAATPEPEAAGAVAGAGATTPAGAAGDAITPGPAAGEGKGAAVAAAGGAQAEGAVGQGQGRAGKPVRKRVVVRSAMGDGFDDLDTDPAEKKDQGAGGEEAGAEGTGAGDGTAAKGGSADAGGQGQGEAQAEGEADGDGELEVAADEEGEGEGAAAAPVDEEAEHQRQLREAALRDRIGGRGVPEAPARPLSDVLGKIMARQRSLVERTRANAPVPDAAAQQAAAAAAQQPPPPPTFNVRALMQSLAQAKQQQQQSQPTASRPASAAAAAPSAAAAVAAATTVAAAAAVATVALDQAGAASQVELELRLGTLVDPMDLQLGSAAGDAAAEAAAGGAAAVEAPGSPVRAGSEENDGDLVIEDDQPKAPMPPRSPFGVIRGLKPVPSPLRAGAPCPSPLAACHRLALAQDTQVFLMCEDSQQPNTHSQQGAASGEHRATGAGGPAAGADGGACGGTLVPVVDLAHRAPSVVLGSVGYGSQASLELGSLEGAAMVTLTEGSEDQTIAGQQQQQKDRVGQGAAGGAGHGPGAVRGKEKEEEQFMDMEEEDDLIVEPDPEEEQKQAEKAAKKKQQQAREAEAKEAAEAGDPMEEDEDDEEEAADTEEEAGGEEEEEADEEESEELVGTGAAKDAGEEGGEGEEEEEEEAGEGEGEDGEGGEGEEDEAEYDVDEEFDSTDEEDAVEPEALHFEEAEDIEAEAAGLKPIDAAATGAADAAPTAPLSPSKDEAAIRKRMVDVMIAAAKERHAARLAAARKRAAEAKGAGAYFVDAEAELSDDEEGLAGLGEDDLLDEYDGEDLDEGVLASLLGNAKESRLDESRRVSLHAMWEAERDSAAVREMLEALRRGFRRKRKGGLGMDDDEEVTDADARRRRANLFASTAGDDDDAPITLPRGHGLDLDLVREDDEPAAGVIAAANTQGDSQAGTQDGAEGSEGARVARAPLPLAAKLLVGRTASGAVGAESAGGEGAKAARVLDPVEARRALRQQSQEEARQAAAAAGRLQPDDGLVPSPEPLALRLGRSGSSYAHGQGPSTGRLRDPHQPHHEEDGGRSHVVALLQRSASAAVGAQGPGAGAGQLPAGQQQQQAEGVGAAAAAGGGAPPRAPGGHRFTLFGSDITNRGGGGGAEHLQSSSFLGRSAAPTSHRTTSNVGGLNTRSFIFAADTSNSGFPDKSRDGATTNANSTGAAAGAAAGSGGAGAQAEGGQGGAAGAGGLASFAELRKVIASGGDKAGGKKGGGGGLMGLLGLGAGGGQGAGGGGQGGAGGRDSALELKRKLVGGEGMGANKRR